MQDRDIIYIVIREDGKFYNGIYIPLQNYAFVEDRLSKAAFYEDIERAQKVAKELNFKTNDKYRFEQVILSID